jgi:3-oxoacyl-[acyl-carrier protein] reductase
VTPFEYSFVCQDGHYYAVLINRNKRFNNGHIIVNGLNKPICSNRFEGSMAGKLKGKTALITGAGRGIGRATAIRFAEEGANLILLSRTRTELEETARDSEDKNVKVHWETVDLADRNRIDRFFDNIPKGFAPIDILINNAALFDKGLMSEYPADRLNSMLNVNLMAPFYLSQKFTALRHGKQGGSIVNISSYSGLYGVEKFPGFGAYNITKYALWGLTEILALEHKNIGLRVNQLTLSSVETGMFHQAFPNGGDPQLTMDEVTERILFLASDDSAPMTGQNIIMPPLD